METSSINDMDISIDTLSVVASNIEDKIGSTEGTLAELKNYTESSHSVSSSGGVLIIDLSYPASVFYTTLTESITAVTLTNAPSGVVSITLEVTQHASSPKTLLWGSGWMYNNSTAPTVTATVSRKDFFVIYTRDGGATKIVGPSWYNVA